MRGGNTPGAKRIAGIHSGHSGKRIGTNPNLRDEMGIFPISLPRGAITVFCGVGGLFKLRITRRTTRPRNWAPKVPCYPPRDLIGDGGLRRESGPFD